MDGLQGQGGFKATRCLEDGAQMEVRVFHHLISGMGSEALGLQHYPQICWGKCLCLCTTRKGISVADYRQDLRSSSPGRIERKLRFF